ncbi:related to Protein CLP1 [Saccharomycodes ludwigii]|uniref:Polynucleotide 5'-hydroxyl-kinase GRC3 n=1 Tax=Saccharomycodes ludwigii TaxID=36035 RepID=A0A376B9Z9_9ASCO|nr:hypothetical protein SCDLUD_002174 [Saccharomycodes ludwigii]KAH3902354.1 hypothetical protein SCDLUD_002174 [Saccharomycodes ludwigii]SSD61399.1 related to Protein CLP1 [Saccharomycodes ludwigii]
MSVGNIEQAGSISTDYHMEDALNNNNEHLITIPREHELKFQLLPDQQLIIEIVYGIAEIFGTELANNIKYIFNNQDIFSIYAVDKTQLKWYTKESAVEPMITQSPNSAYAEYKIKIYNLHFALDKMRFTSSQGPNVLVIGGKNTGKTTLCKTLVSYAIKVKNFTPLYVNLNPTDGIFTPPGCLSATTIYDILDVTAPNWGQSATTGVTTIPSTQPIIKNFGLEYIHTNYSLYNTILSQLSIVTNSKIMKDPLLRRSGCIIDTPSLLDKSDMGANEKEHVNKIISQIIKLYNVNVIVILKEEKDDEDNSNNYEEIIKQQLTSSLSSIKDSISLLTLPIVKKSNVVEIDDVYKRFLQRVAIRDYFYGNSLNTVLSPYTVSSSFNKLTVWEPVVYNNDTDEDKNEEPKLEPVTVNASNLQHAIVAITFAERNADPDTVLSSSIMGFGLINEVNDTRKKLRILIPVPGQMPDKALILTQYRYLE